MPLKLNGSTSGYVQLDAPSVAGTTAITVPAISGTLIVADSNGNVGIGTASPISKLQVSGGADSTIRNTASSGSSWFVGSNTSAYMLHNESNTPMVFTTNGIERMRIDASGRVTRPYSPAFIVLSNAGTATYTTGQKVVYNQIVKDYNSNYNTASSRFTAPVAGMYMFKAQLWSYSSNQGAARFAINGTQAYGSFGNEATQIGFNGYSLVEILYLNASDFVEVYCRFSTVYTDSGFSSFSGFLIG